MLVATVLFVAHASVARGQRRWRLQWVRWRATKAVALWLLHYALLAPLSGRPHVVATMIALLRDTHVLRALKGS
jgi:hypothetical protein